jgi:hypothetical protein
VHFGAFQILAGRVTRQEIVDRREVIVLAVLLLRTRRARRVRNRQIALSPASSAFTSVDLPAPEGATTMNRLPG